MPGNPTLSTTIAIDVAASVTGVGLLGMAQAADTSRTDQPNSTQAPPSGAAAAEQNRSGGQFSPGRVPTKNQATTEPSVTPNGVGAAQDKKSDGDVGPGGAPTTGQAATNPQCRPSQRAATNQSERPPQA